MKAQDRHARATGVVLFGAHEPGQPARVEVRAFAPSCGVNEDPVCGSGNGCMAVFVRDTGQAARFGTDFIASQGQVVGRAGRLRIVIGPDWDFFVRYSEIAPFGYVPDQTVWYRVHQTNVTSRVDFGRRAGYLEIFTYSFSNHSAR